MSSNFTDPPDGISEADHESFRETYDDHDVPADLRDQIEGPDEWLRPAHEVDDPLSDVRADGGLDQPLPEKQRRHMAVPPGTPQITRDASLSRAVDVQAAGGNPAALGMSGETEIGHPGPLAPDAESQPAAAEGEPAGKWGSSGSPTD
jgi:hypothetical protein